VAPSGCSENVVVLRGSEHNAEPLLGLRMVDAKLRTQELIEARHLLRRDAEPAHGRMLHTDYGKSSWYVGVDLPAYLVLRLD
jgi:hypothetical protein